MALSKKPSLARAPRLKEAEKILKERKAAKKAAEKNSSDKKVPVKKTTAKKTVNKTLHKKNSKDPMWKHLAEAIKKLD